MKRFFILFLFFAACHAYAFDFNLYCKGGQEIYTTSKSSGKTNLAAKKLIETAIEKDLGRQFKSDFKVELDIYDLKRLKKGEFKKINISANSLKYEGISISDFQAATVCPYNRVIYKRGRISYPDFLPMAFTSKITNDDLDYIVNSEEFLNGFFANGIKINGHDMFKLLKPEISIVNSSIKLLIPVKTVFSKKPLKINLTAEAEVSENNIFLKNITFSDNSNIIIMNISDYFRKNPIAITNSVSDGKFCKIYISKAQIENNVIKAEGIFLINKNHGG